jgi:hypothetical protein
MNKLNNNRYGIVKLTKSWLFQPQYIGCMSNLGAICCINSLHFDLNLAVPL